MTRPTIEQALRQGAELLGNENASLEAQLLLGLATGRGRSSLFAWSDQHLDEREHAHYRKLLERRLSGEPIAHITGTREFWSLPLQVSPATLIPRADTECLVEEALALDLPLRARVLDLGTGSGAIALALASERPGWQLTATDRSADALAVARDNARALGLESVRFRASDWFAGLELQRFELILSNPPYIARQDPHLHQGDLRFEPLTALTSGPDGLDDLRRIIGEAPAWLSAGGWLVLEHGYDQGQAVAVLLANSGFQHIRLRHDYGGQPRVSLGQWPGPTFSTGEN